VSARKSARDNSRLNKDEYLITCKASLVIKIQEKTKKLRNEQKYSL